MRDKKLQKNMSLKTYISILRYYKSQNIKDVRILWWEPLLFKDLRNFLILAQKAKCKIIIFSNINTPNSLLKSVFTGLDTKNIRINCNINNWNFYTPEEKIKLQENIEFLQSLWIEIIIWYNIYNYDDPSWPISLAIKNNIHDMNLKITNSSIGEEIMIDNSQRKLWKFIFDIIEKNYKKLQFSISCGLKKSIFTDDEIQFMQEQAKMTLKYGCSWNDGKFDINTDWNMFKCYPLQKLSRFHKGNKIQFAEQEKTPYKTVLEKMQKWLRSEWECTAHSIIRSKK